MATNVIAATPKVIDTIKKANILVNSSTLSETIKKGATTLREMNTQSVTSAPLVAAKVKSGNGIIGYTCDIYGNGLAEAPTDTGTVFLANGASSIFVLPAGTIIYVQKYPIVVHGGVE